MYPDLVLEAVPDEGELVVLVDAVDDGGLLAVAQRRLQRGELPAAAVPKAQAQLLSRETAFNGGRARKSSAGEDR